MARRVKITPNNFVNLDSNISSCANCEQRDPWKSYCKLFQKNIEKVNQRNGGFHHNRCENCINGEAKNESLSIEEQTDRFNNWLERYLKAKKELEKINREE